MRLFHPILIAFLFALILYSCTYTGLETPCTMELRTFHLTVLTPAGEPADSVQIDVTNKDTGEKYNACREVYGDSCDQIDFEGTYIIFADGLEDDLNKEGEKIFAEVIGTREDLGFAEEFTFEFDGCHVFKAAGPDTVSLKSK